MMKYLSIPMLVLVVLALVVQPVMALVKLPSRLEIDNNVIAEFKKHGVSERDIDIAVDYGRRSEGVSPYMRIYRDVNSGLRVAEVSQLPMANGDGELIQAGWEKISDKLYVSKPNTFEAVITGTSATYVVKEDQPTGYKARDYVYLSPQVFISGEELKPISEYPELLNIDPQNENYNENTLVWDYGIVKRYLRLIEGKILGRWEFQDNPDNDVLIRYNQQGQVKLSLGKYGYGDDAEFISKEVFSKADYPFVVGDTLTVYPDADPESTSCDGVTRRQVACPGNSWTNLVNGVGTDADASGPSGGTLAGYLWEYDCCLNAGEYLVIYRSIFLFDTSALPNDATVTAATLSLYGRLKQDVSVSATPTICIVSSNPASNTDLVAADYQTVGSTQLSSNVTYAGFNDSGYNAFELNSSGIATISLTGISKFGIRNVEYDIPDSAAPWANSGFAGMAAWYADKGVGYKPTLLITYNTATSPTVSSSSASSLTATSAVLNGSVDDDGGLDIDMQGFAWSTTCNSTNPGNQEPPATYTANYTNVSDDFGEGSFSYNVTTLALCTSYCYRAFAHNSEGWVWGDEVSFTTLCDPDIDTLDATYVSATTARLNARVIDDGGQACDVRFCYGTVDSSSNCTDSANCTTTACSCSAYNTTTAWVEDTYETGDTPYLDISSLVTGVTYYYCSQIRNDVSCKCGGQQSFTTELTVDEPNTFVGIPYAEAVSLSWVKGDGSTNTLIRYKEGSYPTGVADGTEVYDDTETSVLHEGLTPGTTYYYTAWGESGGVYSTSNATLMITTSAAVEGGDDFPVPAEPTSWFQAPDYTSARWMPWYGIVNFAAEQFEVPYATMWYLWALMMCVAFGVLFYSSIGNHNLLLSMLVVGFSMVMFVVIDLIPGWHLLPYGVICAVGIFVGERR